MTDRPLCHSEPFGKAQDKLREESFSPRCDYKNVKLDHYPLLQKMPEAA